MRNENVCIRNVTDLCVSCRTKIEGKMIQEKSGRSIELTPDQCKEMLCDKCGELK
jgi:hypothetical protein